MKHSKFLMMMALVLMTLSACDSDNSVGDEIIGDAFDKDSALENAAEDVNDAAEELTE